MKFNPIHEISSDDLDLILHTARHFLEWNIEPKFCHLQALIDSIKESLTHFLPADGDFVRDLKDANEATIIINSFTSVPHPLREGLIAIREIFDLMNIEPEKYNMLGIKWAINDYLISVKPYVLEEKLNNYHSTQSEKRAKRQTWKGKTHIELEARNKKIIEHFKTTQLTPNSFAVKHAAKYAISTRAIRAILKSSIGS